MRKHDLKSIQAGAEVARAEAECVAGGTAAQARGELGKKADVKAVCRVAPGMMAP